jgi:acetoin utilization deacetylase AcuC-like enzyme
MAFSPDLVLISAGFDGLVCDPLGNFLLNETVFGPATRLLMDIADRACSGRIVSVLEGGYNPAGTAAAVEAHCTALARRSPASSTPSRPTAL